MQVGGIGLWSHVPATSLRAMRMRPETATVRLVTRQTVESVEQVVEDVGDEVSELIGGSRQFCNELPFWELLGADTVSDEKALLPSIGSPGNGYVGKLERAPAASCG